MATTDYCTVTEAKATIGIDDNLDTTYIAACVTAASRRIDSYCGRFFYQQANATSAVYEPECNLSVVMVDDISTTSGLVVKVGTGGNYTTTLSSTDYELEPINAVGPNGELWPYTSIRRLNQFYPYSPASLWTRYTVQVTAKFGWPAVPPQVTLACRLLTQFLFRNKDAPFGVAGISDLAAIRVRENLTVSSLLAPYVDYPNASAGIA